MFTHRPPLYPKHALKHVHGMSMTTYKRVLGVTDMGTRRKRNHGRSPLRNSIPICAGAAAPLTAADIRMIVGAPVESLPVESLPAEPLPAEPLPASQLHRVKTIKKNLHELPIIKQPSKVEDQVKLMQMCGDARIQRAIARRKRLELEEQARILRAAHRARARRAKKARKANKVRQAEPSWS